MPGRAIRAVAWLAVACMVDASPRGSSIVDAAAAWDMDCAGDDLEKKCGLSEGECRARCGKAVRCSVYTYNYKAGEGDNAKWDDGCCWLKTACTRPKPMAGKKRGVVRAWVLQQRQPSAVAQELRELRRSSRGDIVAGALAAAKGTEPEVRDWLVEWKGRRAAAKKEREAAYSNTARRGPQPFYYPHLATPQEDG